MDLSFQVGIQARKQYSEAFHLVCRNGEIVVASELVGL